MKAIDYTGRRFGRLVAIRRAPNVGKRTQWECRCDCGTVKVVPYSSLNGGYSQSCGCLRSENLKAWSDSCVTHGQARSSGKTREYRIWRGMRQRCYNPLATKYNRYGGLGVTVCEQWAHFENFYSDMGDCPPGWSLDRIDPYGNYEPCNCRWADAKTQSNNKRRSRVAA